MIRKQVQLNKKRRFHTLIAVCLPISPFTEKFQLLTLFCEPYSDLLRHMVMSSQNQQERMDLQTLQSVYRRAWQKFTVEVEFLHTSSKLDGVSDDLLKAAQTRVDKAAAEYRAARNKLAICLLEQEPATTYEDQINAHAESACCS